MTDKDLDKLRKEIDELDIKLLYLLNQRAELVLQVAKIKLEGGKKLFDPTRERDIFVNLTGKNPGPLTPDAIVRLFERVIDESRRLERTEVFDKKKDIKWLS